MKEGEAYQPWLWSPKFNLIDLKERGSSQNLDNCNLSVQFLLHQAGENISRNTINQLTPEVAYRGPDPSARLFAAFSHVL